MGDSCGFAWVLYSVITTIIIFLIRLIEKYLSFCAHPIMNSAFLRNIIISSVFLTKNINLEESHVLRTLTQVKIVRYLTKCSFYVKESNFS